MDDGACNLSRYFRILHDENSEETLDSLRLATLFVAPMSSQYAKLMNRL